MKKDPGSFQLIISLALTGLFSGVALSGIYSLTFNRIRENRAAAVQKAIKQVLPGAQSSATFLLENNDFILFEGQGAPPGDAVYAGLDEEGKVVGYAIPAQGPGFMDTVKVLYGYLPEQKTIVGLAILESRETPGLGDKIGKDPAFLNCFKKLLVTPTIQPVKEAPTAPNQVDTISGATISSKAVVTMLNQRVEALSQLSFPKELPPKEPTS